MPVSWRGFGSGITNKITLDEIYMLGKAIDDDLACGKRVMADITKDERQALAMYLDVKKNGSIIGKNL